MRSANQLLHTRTRVRPRYALLPIEGFPTSRLPGWEKAEVRVLASPALGAEFVQYLFKLEPGATGSHKSDGRVEAFFYCLSGDVKLTLSEGGSFKLAAGGFALVPPTVSYQVESSGGAEVILLRKVFEAAPDVAMFKPLVGNQSSIPAPAWMNNEHTRLQLLIPDELQYDLAMNIFTFDPGHRLPYVETHVMEHGAYILQGRGVYYLENEWMEVEATDFIWMGPYCPQSFYATGTEPARYIYYKNVNREIPL